MVVFTILVSQAARTKTAASRQKRNFIKSERVNLLQKQSSFGILEPQSIHLVNIQEQFRSLGILPVSLSQFSDEKTGKTEGQQTTANDHCRDDDRWGQSVFVDFMILDPVVDIDLFQFFLCDFMTFHNISGKCIKGFDSGQAGKSPKSGFGNEIFRFMGNSPGFWI